MTLGTTLSNLHPTAHGRVQSGSGEEPRTPVRQPHDRFEPISAVQFELPPPSLNCRLQRGLRAGLRACAGAALGAATGALTGFATLGGVGGYALGYSAGRGEAAATGVFSALLGMAGLMVGGAYQLGAGAAATSIAIAAALVGAIAGAMLGLHGAPLAGVEDSLRENLGLELASAEQGYCITGVRPGGLAAAAGLKVGDRVSAAELRSPKNPAEGLQALEQRLVAAHHYSHSRSLKVTRDSAPLQLCFPRTSPYQRDWPGEERC